MNNQGHTGRSLGEAASYRLAVASRVLAAVIGGYALTSVMVMLLSVIWPAPRAQAVMWASMLSFALYAAVTVWVFATSSATRAWVGLLTATAVVALLLWLFRAGAAA
ncbi:DUF3649 domain-containing protein [Ottowia thiooxydans]|uniref:Membrane protein YqjE n=1 Tax=Ottowia thiooxydans TaxID=219182 RepID=A0ABV2Q5T9_9BURK